MRRYKRDLVEQLDSPDWAVEEFEQASLGDRRLDRRVVSMVSDFAQRPGAPIPQACGTRAKANAAYNFIRNDFVEPPAILKGHQRASLERLRQESIILVPSDTTSFNFSGLKQTQDLGPIGTKGHPEQRGLWLHSTQAFTPKGLPLGLIAAQWWVRPQDSTDPRDRHQKSFAEKESARWRASWQACQALRRQLPAETLLVNIDDMEGDIYEVFAAALAIQDQPRAELLIRSRHDRKLQDLPEPLWEHLANQPVATTTEVRVPRKPKQPARTAQLEVRFSPVLVGPPSRKADQPPLPLWAVEAREINPPPGSEPILWRLLTTLPVTNAQEALQKVEWYARRWGIEVFHKIVKSVCRAEAHQNESAQNLERLLMLDLLVAWRVQVLTQVGRQQPELPATDYFTQEECQALHAYQHRHGPVLSGVPALGQMMEWIGQLGGFWKCKSNPYPGAITLARGLARLNDLAAMWHLLETIHAKPR